MPAVKNGKHRFRIADYTDEKKPGLCQTDSSGTATADLKSGKADKSRGEAAILELTLILPLIILVLGALIVLGLCLSDRAVMRACTEKYASLIAADCACPGYSQLFSSEDLSPDTSAGSICLMYSENDPYRYLYGFDSVTGDWEGKLTEKLADISLMKYADMEVSVKTESSLRGDFVRLSVKKTYLSFSDSINFAFTADAVCLVCDFDETVRNTDFLDYGIGYIISYIEEKIEE